VSSQTRMFRLSLAIQVGHFALHKKARMPNLELAHPR
jgi:hypothetical protein